jgi:wyosine [tRNA(Phe)-imidazoG37] synthetase (radical SAM superfamily)
MPELTAGHVYGPVPSRRLGRSLGIDLVPMKTCSYDCVYCQLGRTPACTLDRCAWADEDKVISELAARLDSSPDWITLSGSGEPTLHTGLDSLVERIKRLTDIPVALLTNGSMLHLGRIRRELTSIDLLIPSLDAGSEAVFRRINRPHYDLDFEQMLHGLFAARTELRADFWLEVFLVPGFNDDGQSLDDLVEAVDLVGADRVQLNTATRPPAEGFVQPVCAQRLQEIARRFDPAAEIIAEFPRPHALLKSANPRWQILALLRRRPCRLMDIADGLGLAFNEVVKHIEELTSEGRIETTIRAHERWYQAITE